MNNSSNLSVETDFDWSQPPSGIQINRQDSQLIFSSTIRDREQITYGLIGSVGIIGFVGYLIATEIVLASAINGMAIFGVFMGTLIGLVFLMATLTRLFGKVRLIIDIQKKQLQIYTGWLVFSSNKSIALDQIQSVQQQNSQHTDGKSTPYTIKKLAIQVKNSSPIEFGDKLQSTQLNYFKHTLQQILIDRAAGTEDHYLTDDLSQHLIG